MSAPVSVNLPAGRELDALIARDVMGLAYSECRAAEEDVWVSEDGQLWFVLPPYSSSIAAAWEVVEKLKFMWLDKAEPVESTDKRWWRAAFWCGPDDGGHVCESVEETAPLAICRAALKAVGA